MRRSRTVVNIKTTETTNTATMDIAAASQTGSRKLKRMNVRESRGSQGAAEPSIAGIRVLVVDDNHDALEVMEEALTDFGAEVTGVPSVDEAIRVDPSRFDVVLTDLSMPQRTGYDLLRVVRERAPLLPVIAITGHPQERGAPGFAIHLSKPIDHKDLVRAIHRVVTSRKQSEQ